MGDVKTGTPLERQIAEVEVMIAQQTLTVKQTAFRKVQINEELTTLEKNQAAATEALRTLTARLETLQEAMRLRDVPQVKEDLAEQTETPAA